MSLGTAFLYTLGILSAISAVATAVMLIYAYIWDDDVDSRVHRDFPEGFLFWLGIQCIVVAIGASAYIAFLWLTSGLPEGFQHLGYRNLDLFLDRLCRDACCPFGHKTLVFSQGFRTVVLAR
jgi:hypothetical protein